MLAIDGPGLPARTYRRQQVVIQFCRTEEPARVFGLNWDTIAKMCRYSAPPGYVRSKEPEKPKLGLLVPLEIGETSCARPSGLLLRRHRPTLLFAVGPQGLLPAKFAVSLSVEFVRVCGLMDNGWNWYLNRASAPSRGPMMWINTWRTSL